MAGSGPLAGEWSGEMEVAALDETRRFSIELAELQGAPTCVSGEKRPPDGCVKLAWTGAWDVYEGQVAFGRDAALSSTAQVLHCTGGDCEALDPDGRSVPVGRGFFSLYSSWSDGQSISLEASAEEDGDEISGDARYGYTGGAMTGTFELKRL